MEIKFIHASNNAHQDFALYILPFQILCHNTHLIIFLCNSHDSLHHLFTKGRHLFCGVVAFDLQMSKKAFVRIQNNRIISPK